MKCEICETEISSNDIRFNVCWDCATAESIIDEGLDMFDEGLAGEKVPAKTAREKLKFLIVKGWAKNGS